MEVPAITPAFQPAERDEGVKVKPLFTQQFPRGCTSVDALGQELGHVAIPSCKDGCLSSRKVRVLPLKRKRRDNRQNWQFCHKWLKSEGSAELEPTWLLSHLIKVLRGSTLRSGLCAVWSTGFGHISCYRCRFLKLLKFLQYRHVTGGHTQNSIRAVANYIGADCPSWIPALTSACSVPWVGWWNSLFPGRLVVKAHPLEAAGGV